MSAVSEKSENLVLILGASDRADRFAYKAFKLLQEHGHKTVLVNPGLKTVETQEVLPDLSSFEPGSIDTVTLYVGPKILEKHVDALLTLKPRRVIFNPGTESPEIQSKLSTAGITPLVACTLVLLNSSQF